MLHFSAVDTYPMCPHAMLYNVICVRHLTLNQLATWLLFGKRIMGVDLNNVVNMF